MHDLRRLVFLFSILLSCLIAYPQVSLSVKRDAKESVVFYVQNNTHVNYHIIINVTLMDNLETTYTMPFGKNVGQGKSRVFQLLKIDPSSPIDYNYTWSYKLGWANPDVNEKVAYLMPVRSGNRAEVIKLSGVDDKHSQDEKGTDILAVGFKMSKGDTVYAARRGMVETIKNTGEPEGTNLSYSKTTNSITIRHPDKTVMDYSVLKSSSFFVNSGDFVEAGDPLAIVGGENYILGPHVRLSSRYLSFNKRAERNEYYTSVYFIPVFATADKGKLSLIEGEEYTSLHTQPLIRQEWTKRELKKAGKKKKK